MEYPFMEPPPIQTPPPLSTVPEVSIGVLVGPETRERDIFQIMFSANATRAMAEDCYDDSGQDVVGGIIEAVERVHNPRSIQNWRIPRTNCGGVVVFKRSISNTTSTWEQTITRHVVPHTPTAEEMEALADTEIRRMDLREVEFEQWRQAEEQEQGVDSLTRSRNMWGRWRAAHPGVENSDQWSRFVSATSLGMARVWERYVETLQGERSETVMATADFGYSNFFPSGTDEEVRAFDAAVIADAAEAALLNNTNNTNAEAFDSISYGDSYSDEEATEDDIRAFDSLNSGHTQQEIKLHLTRVMTRLDLEMERAAGGDVFSEGGYQNISESLRDIYELVNEQVW